MGCAVWQEVDPAGCPEHGGRVVPGFGALFDSRGATRVARSSIPLATLWKGCPPMSIWPANRVNPIASCREANVSSTSVTDPPTTGSPGATIGSVWRQGTGLRNRGSRYAEEYGRKPGRVCETVNRRGR